METDCSGAGTLICKDLTVQRVVKLIAVIFSFSKYPTTTFSLPLEDYGNLLVWLHPHFLKALKKLSRSPFLYYSLHVDVPITFNLPLLLHFQHWHALLPNQMP